MTLFNGLEYRIRVLLSVDQTKSPSQLKEPVDVGVTDHR